jgi:hypothetical protein
MIKVYNCRYNDFNSIINTVRSLIKLIATVTCRISTGNARFTAMRYKDVPLLVMYRSVKETSTCLYYSSSCREVGNNGCSQVYQ